jgi:hypothetical protein
MPENRNSGIGSEVDFLCNELLRRFHDNSQPIPRQSIVRFCTSTEELNSLERCSPVQLEKQLRARRRADQFKAEKSELRRRRTEEVQNSQK